MEEPIVASDNAETALAVAGELPGPPPRPPEPSSSDEESEEGEPPPGAVDPEKCSVGGPGTTGGAAQTPVSFYVHAKDSRDTRVREGGDYVVVRVTPGNAARAGGAKDGEAIVRDNGDGSYTATYSVEARGDYQLSVEINGCAIGGSPFPVFFSPPEERPAGEAPQLRDAAGAPVDSETASAAAQLTAPAISIMGADAYAANVDFPEGPALDRSVLVGNLNQQVSLEQLAQLFSFSGQVAGCRFAGDGGRFAFVEFGMQREAEQALTLDKMLVIDRAIRVELARTAFDSRGQSRVTQFAALQLQQIARLQAAAVDSHALAAHVAQMRVAAKQGGAPPAPGVQLHDSERQKAAALSAIAALSKRLAGGGGGKPPERARSPSPRPGKRRRTVSPTIRYRRRSRSRSRSRSPRRRRSSPRRRTPPVIRLRSRSRSRKRRASRRGSSRRRSRSRSRSRDRRRDSRDGRQRSSVERQRERSRDRSRERRRDSRDGRRGGSSERRRASAGRRREHSRERERSRERGEGRRESGGGGRRASGGGRRGSAASDRDRREERRERTPFWEPRKQEEPSPAVQDPSEQPAANAPAQPGAGEAQANGSRGGSASQAAEAQELREKALQAMASLGSNGGAAAEESAGAGEPAEAKEKKEKKERKEKKHKKEKRRRREREGSEPRSD